MCVVIQINEAVIIDGRYGVQVNELAIEINPLELHAAIKLGFQLAENEHLRHACSGGENLFTELRHGDPFRRFTVAEFLDTCREIDFQEALTQATRGAKRHHTKRRRAQYTAVRSELFLAMLNAGIPHVCVHPDCNVMDDLTIDHIVPVSRGGSDAIENLQFMCRTHNSQKCDRLAVG